MNVAGMRGLGDNIYQRAFLGQVREPVYLETPWPELYLDMPHVHPVRCATTLRTQSKNMQRHTQWNVMPRGPVHQIRYGSIGIIPGMSQTFGVPPGPLTLPHFGLPPVAIRPYVVVRPVTVREEWRADTRNPLPEYIAWAAQEMRRRGFVVVSVADLAPGQEWALDPLPPADICFHSGELPVEELLALVQNAEAVIGGIGWILPACLAARVPAWIVCGGQGGFNAPELITHPALDPSCISFAVPDRFCRCTQKQHNCDKRISDYDTRFTAWADRLPPVVR